MQLAPKTGEMLRSGASDEQWGGLAIGSGRTFGKAACPCSNAASCDSASQQAHHSRDHFRWKRLSYGSSYWPESKSTKGILCPTGQHPDGFPRSIGKIPRRIGQRHHANGWAEIDTCAGLG